MDPIRDEINRLLDILPAPKVVLVKQLLEALIGGHEDVDPEPLTPEDLEDIKEAKAAFERGEFVSWDEVKRELDQLDAEEDAKRG